MIERATKVVEKCFDEGEYPDPQVVLGDAEKTFLEIGGSAGNTMPWSAAVDDSFKRIDRMFESGGKLMEGLSTGYKYLDETLQGLKPVACDEHCRELCAGDGHEQRARPL